MPGRRLARVRMERRERRERKERRRRRPPEVARQEILDAAERVFVEFHPDQVGLKEIGREAHVSHALVTHYFGTYAGLVEAVLERRIRTIRESMLERLRQAGALSRPAELLAALFRALEDPVHLRLTKWMIGSDRPAAAHAFALREQGLQRVAQQVAAAIAAGATDSTTPPSRELVGRVEIALLAAVAAAYGYALGKYALAGALGREVGGELDAEVHATLARMLEGHLRTALARDPSDTSPKKTTS